MSTDMFSSRLETFFGPKFGQVFKGWKACYGILNRRRAFYCVPRAVKFMDLCQFKYHIIVIYYVLAFC